ncbi:MAG TPA: aconitase X catalytic domain-containing protein, partial [Gemmatimonadaceae bacterium]|nr:aconitase X catalytic domain-containing protein [Gemmatimonadaceae bacterium]
MHSPIPPEAAAAALPPRGDLAHAILDRYAALTGARRLIPITRAHIDGCLYHGPASLDFARTMAESGATVTVPTTLNVGAIDLLHPTLFRGRPEIVEAGRAMMRHYVALGCRQTWTCAPYQLLDRPALGEQIAWAESNAIVFANSVLGARTERYGDFIDLCAALVGAVPEVGLHTDDGRLGRVLVRVRGVSERAMARDAFHAALGHLLGQRAGSAIPVIDGVPCATEDHLKALGAAAASSGAVAMFHMVGVTPEAPTRRAAFGGRPPARVIDLGPEDFRVAMRELTSTRETALGAVSIGTPHFSYDEFTQLRALLEGRRVHERVEFFVSTGRDILARIDREGWGAELRTLGVQVVTDTCTYLSPVLTGRPGAVMTNSAKWAWYAPNNLGYQVVFGSLEECVESAVRGEAWRDESVWEDAASVGV